MLSGFGHRPTSTGGSLGPDLIGFGRLLGLPTLFGWRCCQNGRCCAQKERPVLTSKDTARFLQSLTVFGLIAPLFVSHFSTVEIASQWIEAWGERR